MSPKNVFTRTVLVFLLLATIVIRLNYSAQANPDEERPHVLGDPVFIVVAENAANAPSEPAPPASVTGGDNFAFLPLVTNNILGPEGQAVVDLVNAERTQAGCAPLQVSAQLAAAAQGHSQDMAINDFFSHTSQDGRSPWDRINDTGYSFSMAAENIAAGYTTAAAAVNGWMNSSGHRANILNCGLEETGVGYYYLANDTGDVNYYHYWTQVFATP